MTGSYRLELPQEEINARVCEKMDFISSVRNDIATIFLSGEKLHITLMFICQTLFYKNQFHSKYNKIRTKLRLYTEVVRNSSV